MTDYRVPGGVEGSQTPGGAAVGSPNDDVADRIIRHKGEPAPGCSAAMTHEACDDWIDTSKCQSHHQGIEVR